MYIKLSFYVVIFFTKIIINQAQQQYFELKTALPHNVQPFTLDSEFINASYKLETFFSEPINSLKIIRSFDNGTVSTDCVGALTAIFFGLLKKEPWVLSMIDATGKIGSGLIEGNFVWTGSYSVCTSVVQGPPFGEVNPFHGQYCWGHFSPAQVTNNTNNTNTATLDLRVGLCFPDVCSTHDVSTILSEFLNVTSIDKVINVTEVDCIPSDPNIWDDYRAVICLVFCCLVVTFIAVATFYDMYTQFQHDKFIKIPTNTVGEIKSEEPSPSENASNSIIFNDDVKLIQVHQSRNKGTLTKILLCFSFYTNGSKLFNLKLESNTLPCLNGIRVFSMAWVILGHTYITGLTSSDNILVALSWTTKFSFLFIVQGVFAVDSFFVLSGLLVTYLYLKECDKARKISWIKFYVHRYWRLTPVYIVVLFLFENILSKYYSNGPFWPQIGFNGENCDKYWWWNVLYINNFLSIKNMCMGHSWYLANDMQFYVISPLILIFLTKSPPISAIISGVIILISWICTGVIADYYNLINILSAESNLDYFDYMYEKPYCRIGPYIMGMVCGYLLHRSNCSSKMNKITVLCGWLIALGLSSSVVFGTYHSNMSRGVGALYVALSRSSWALALCWMIFACCNGYGGVINHFLSWPIWQPLGRLTYSSYLIHLVIIRVYFFSLDLPPHFSQSYMMFSFLGCFVASYFCAVFISLVFESPLLAVEKLLVKKS